MANQYFSPIRPIVIKDECAYITLTRGYTSIIDAVDAPLVKDHNWCALVGANNIYGMRTVLENGRTKTILLHRVIMSADKGIHIDHIDGDGLNNRRSNLRFATPSQNMQNKRKKANGTSRFKGVSWDKSHNKWRSQIRLNGVVYKLGTFDDEELAHKAYCIASAKFHGEFGKT